MKRMLLAVLAITLAVTATTTQPAFAYKSFNWRGYVYKSPNQTSCVWLNTSISNEAKPHLWSTTSWDASGAFGSGPCGDHGAIIPAGQLAVRQDLYVWDGPANGWLICNYGPWVYNTSWSHSVPTGFAWSRPPCGPGYYLDYAYGFVYTTEQWHGGGMYTPNYGNSLSTLWIS